MNYSQISNGICTYFDIANATCEQTDNLLSIHPFQSELLKIYQKYLVITANINFYSMLFGIVNNMLCIIIFLDKTIIKRKFNRYLLVLAITEFIFCLLAFINYFYYIVYTKSITLVELNDFAFISIVFILHFLDSFAVSLTLLLSIDRLYAIFKPMKIKNFITFQYQKSLILAVFIFYLLIKIPEIMLYFSNRFIYHIYSTIITSALLIMIPGVIIFVLNTILFIKIYKYDKTQKSASTFIVNMKKTRYSTAVSIEDRLNEEEDILSKVNNYKPLTRAQKSHFIVIITIAAWLLFTTIPYYIIWWITIVHRYQFILKIQYISSILFNINHCTNILIYIFFHDGFRRCLSKRISSFITKFK